VKVVAERLGDTPEMVLSTYAHLWPGDDDRTREAVDGVLLGRRVSDSCHGETGATQKRWPGAI
jgi:hypothetical protein